MAEDEDGKVSLELLGTLMHRLIDDVGGVKQGISELKQTTQRTERNVTELQVSVAAIATSQGLTRQDIDGLKETVARIERSFDFESRIRRIETHLGLSHS